MKVLLPSLINEQLFVFDPHENWRDIYKKYADEGVDRNPFIKHLPKQGVEVVQFWINHEQAQKSWAKEFKIKYNEKSWFLEILEAQILKESPDVVYNTTLTVIPYSFIKRVKQKLNRKVFWICYYGVPRKGEFRNFEEYDFYLTGFDLFEEQLRQAKEPFAFFAHYYDDQAKINEIQFNDRKIPFSFLGTLIYKSHTDLGNYRRRIVEALLEQGHLQCWSDLPSENYTKDAYKVFRARLLFELYNFINCLPHKLHLFKNLPFIKGAKNWNVSPKPEHFINPRLKKVVNPPRFGFGLYEFLQDSKITLNIHAQVYPSVGPPVFTAGNIRLFEATGSKCCLLTDYISGIERYFEPEQEIVTFSSKEEAIEKSNFLLNNPKVARSIAEKGHEKTLYHHSSTVRAGQFVEILKQYA